MKMKSYFKNQKQNETNEPNCVLPWWLTTYKVTLKLSKSEGNTPKKKRTKKQQTKTTRKTETILINHIISNNAIGIIISILFYVHSYTNTLLY